jgi:catechol 2,3-dioxygenase-like lactoylglutathione lyase family enzyme
MPKLDGIIETALYVDDVDRACDFYRQVLQLSAMLESETLSAFNVGDRSVLLIFKRGGSLRTQIFSGGPGTTQGQIPPHDGNGPVHMCFAIPTDQLSAWEARLGEYAVAIEGRTRWPRGGQSIYFRDPDGHLLEMLTPGLWPIY